MNSNKTEIAKNAAKDAIIKTIENKFDIYKTACELSKKYGHPKKSEQ